MERTFADALHSEGVHPISSPLDQDLDIGQRWALLGSTRTERTINRRVVEHGGLHPVQSGDSTHDDAWEHHDVIMAETEKFVYRTRPL